MVCGGMTNGRGADQRQGGLTNGRGGLFDGKGGADDPPTQLPPQLRQPPPCWVCSTIQVHLQRCGTTTQLLADQVAALDSSMKTGCL